MEGGQQTFDCGRCGTEFPVTATHTELVRRDFVDYPRPARVERLCADCLKTYVEEFLGREYDAVLADYDADV
jgi:hypothetical protein